jgi:protein-disulfide isomerase
MKIKLILIFTAVLAFVAAAPLQLQEADASSEYTLSSENILRDPRIPAEGNPSGDVTIAEYFDYRCLTCKKVNPVLQQIVHDDGHIRLVFKDWPIFGGISIYAARLGLAAKFQNKFSEAHEALISVRGKLSEENVRTILAKTGIDVPRAQRDLIIHQKEIDAILARNHQQATALGYEGPPAFIIGNFRVPAVFNTASFNRIIADARAAAKRESKSADDGR